MPGSARPSEGEQTPKHYKNFLRHAKAKSQILFYGETRSQACQDLLDQVNASRLPSIIKNYLRHAKTKSQSLFYGETRSQACQDLLDQAKASRLPSVIKFFFKACKG